MYRIILTDLVIHDLFVYLKLCKLSIMSHKGLYFKWKVKIYFSVCVDYNGSNVKLLKSIVYPSYVWRLLECNSNGISSCGVLNQVISSRLKSVKIEYSLKVKLQDFFRTRCVINFTVQ